MQTRQKPQTQKIEMRWGGGREVEKEGQKMSKKAWKAAKKVLKGKIDVKEISVIEKDTQPYIIVALNKQFVFFFCFQ